MVRYAFAAMAENTTINNQEKKMDIEKIIEFDKIKEMWMNLAVTEEAKEKIRKMSYCLEETKLRKMMRDTTQGKNLMEKLGTPPLQNTGEIHEILNAAELGSCLTPSQLGQVERVLASIRRLKLYLERGKDFGNSLAYYEENLDSLESLREEISRQIRNEEVDDYASKDLARIRKEIVKCREEMKGKAEQVMRTHKACMADNFCTFRGGRVCVPVKKEFKLKIPGSVLDKSSTGNTLFIEPAGAAKYYEELQRLSLL